jgi:precorrin-6B methylase 2
MNELMKEPWLSIDFINIFKSWDTSNWDMFEWGSGGSTIWFAQRVRSLVSIEHDINWYRVVKKGIVDLGLKNVELLLIDPEATNNVSYRWEGYVKSIFKYDGFDCILVDGRHRVTCIKNAIEKVRGKGVIILDDAEREKYSEAHEVLNKFEHFSTIGKVNTQEANERTDYWVIP